MKSNLCYMDGKPVRSGDRVITQWGRGEIVAFSNSMFGVRHDSYNEVLHNLYGNCEDGHGWWYNKETVGLVTLISRRCDLAYDFAPSDIMSLIS